jgi:hypothetical protein
MHAYCTGSKVLGGLLVYGEGGASPRHHQIRGSDTTISVTAVDLGGGPDDIRASIATVATEARHLVSISEQRYASALPAKLEP